MTQLTLRLFGPGVLTADGAVVRTHSARTLALLAFLVLESDRPHLRASLVGLLWEGLPEASGRQSLRQALYSLRTVAGGRLNGCLRVDHEWVQFASDARDAPVDIDVHRFLAAVRSTDERLWREASALYKAPLLDHRNFENCTVYETWLAAARERLHALAMQNLGRLVAGHMARVDWDAAIGYAEAMQEVDPTSEAASQYLLRIFAAKGELHAIDAEWARLCSVLLQEFGVEPSAETAQLHRVLRQRSAGSSESAPATLDRGDGVRFAAGIPRVAGEVDSIVRAGQAAERVHAFSQAADLYDRALKVMKRFAPASLQRCCDVLLLREAALERLGRRADQESAIDEALAIAEVLDDFPRVAAILLRRAGACAYLGRHDEARCAAERALKIYRHIGDRPAEAEALRELGFVHWHAEDYAAALQQSRDALALHRQMGDITGEATALHNLAEIHRGLGSPRQATQLFEQALRLHWAARNHGGEILSLFGWGYALYQTGDLPGSKQKYEAALELSVRHGERAMHSRGLHALAMQHAAQGELDTAIALMRQAIEVDRAIGYAHALGHDLVDLSYVHCARGEIAQARVALQEALVWFDFTEGADALQAIRTLLTELETNGRVPALPSTLRRGVKSHLPLSEGKVYCEFESPLGGSPGG
ncbi:MAG: tetratricopeptide repeat protein [Rubrivivax sp.]|nr:tetratricopeptide repeat protein [Rubrivivax sp.]